MIGVQVEKAAGSNGPLYGEGRMPRKAPQCRRMTTTSSFVLQLRCHLSRFLARLWAISS